MMIIYSFNSSGRTMQTKFDSSVFILLKHSPISERTYEPPDPPGYFELCVYPEYLQHMSFVKEHVRDVVYIDGTESPENNFQLILNDIRQLLRF